MVDEVFSRIRTAAPTLHNSKTRPVSGVNAQKKAAIGLPTIKQFYIQLKKDENISSFFARDLACKV